MKTSLGLSKNALRSHEMALWCWGLMLFFLPFSTALALFFSTFGAIFSVAGLRKGLVFRVLGHPVALLVLALYVWLAVSAAWSVAPKDELIEGILKYRKLLFAVLIAASIAACAKPSKFLINFFLAGCLIVAIGSLASRLDILTFLLGPSDAYGGWAVGGSPEKSWFYVGGPDNPTFGRNHITQGTFLVFAATLSLARCWERFVNPLAANHLMGGLWGLLSFVYLQVTFLLQGRSGYLLAFILFTVYAGIGFKKLAGIKRLVPTLIAVTSATIFIFSSPNLAKRTQEAIQDVQQHQNRSHDSSDSERLRSQEQRLIFWTAGGMIFLSSPIAGTGVGSYAESFSKLPNSPRGLAESRSQPHSEVVLLAIQGGGVAVGLYLAIIFFTVKSIFIQNSSQVSGLLLVALLFFIYSTFNSAIWDLAEGHFFSIIMGILISHNFGATLVKKSRDF